MNFIFQEAMEENISDACSKGGEHNWIIGMKDIKGGSITSWECSKCGKERSIEPSAEKPTIQE